jgi:oxygen-independent coproporphyrinogen-3 oxidase
MPLGVYISVPFCRTKCSYCNFASDVFSRAVFERYVSRVCEDISRIGDRVMAVGGKLEPRVDSVYFGGGTPSLLDPAQLERLFATLDRQFTVTDDAEITVECAPGTITPELTATLTRLGVNRVSLGVQSFVDKEAAAVGRQHKRAIVSADIENFRAAGISNLNIDLIAGLPHQTAESWEFSLQETIASGVPHVSVYLLEVDEDSRLGRELIAGGARYHAHFVPDEDATADYYEMACERFDAARVEQYEISNFARPGWESKHNLKYWTRQPYVGFGVDAHSMLPSVNGRGEAVRFSSLEPLEAYVAGKPGGQIAVTRAQAQEEALFLGLRLTRGVDLAVLEREYGALIGDCQEAVVELVRDGLMQRIGQTIRLTRRGRLLSNEVFQRFISASGPGQTVTC